jgi:hypothetical protein
MVKEGNAQSAIELPYDAAEALRIIATFSCADAPTKICSSIW